MRFSVNKSIFFSIGLLTITVFAVIFISLRQSEKINDTSQSIETEEQVSSLLQQLTSAVLDNETGSRGYLITGLRQFLDPLISSERALDELRIQLNKKVTDHEILHLLNDSISPLIDKRKSFSWDMISLYQENKQKEAADLVKGGGGEVLHG